jgi:hypothetical protein
MPLSNFTWIHSFTTSLGDISESSDISKLKKIIIRYKTHRYYNQFYIIAYKFVSKKDRLSPIQYFNKISYLKGAIIEIPRDTCCMNVKEDCGAGINVASNWWCIKEAKGSKGRIDDKKFRIIQLKVYLKDIVCIPNGDTGKFRVCKVEVLN